MSQNRGRKPTKTVLVSPWLADMMGQYSSPRISANDPQDFISEAHANRRVPTRILVETVPPSMFYLRSIVSEIPKTRPVDADEVDSGTRRGSPKPPLNLDAMSAADSQLEELAFWASEMGVSTDDVGPVWRVRGDIRGVLYGSALAAELLAERVLEQMDAPDYQEPPEMHLRMSNQRAKQAEYWPTLMDILSDANREMEQENDDPDW